MNTLLLCPWEAAKYFIYSSNIPTLFFYSHGPAVLVALILGILILYKGHKSISSILLFIITILFSSWCIFDLVIWASNSPSVVMFFWSLQILFEPLIYAISIYLTYVFIKGKDLSFRGKLILSGLFSPFIIFLSTKINLIGVSLMDCNALEGPISLYYSYFFEILSVVTILGIFVRSYRSNKINSLRKREIKYFTLGMIMFLLAFSWGNLIGSFTDNWTLAQFGLIGMPIFFGFLAYISVKFKTFNLKIIGAQVLVFALGLLVLSISFIRYIQNVRLVVLFTLIIVIILGYQLIRGVRLEVKQKERLQELSHNLEKSNLSLEEANEKLKGLDKLKTEFLSLASHQLRSPLTAIKGYASMLIEGSFGKLEPKQEESAKRIYTSAQGLVNTVEDLLNISKIEQGGMKYEFMPTDMAVLVTDLYNEMKVPAESKKLDFTLEMSKGEKFMVNADPVKLKQVLLNLTDNSIKYTKEGFVHLSLKREENVIVFSVSDNGMGISPETRAKLFEKFSRGEEGGKTNTGGSGLGLYLAKQIATAHKGDVTIESEGEGKGSTFSVIIPALEHTN